MEAGGKERAANRVRPQRTGVISISDATYARGLQLDLYLPRGGEPAGGRPAVIAFPGGAWKWADRKDYATHVSRLAKLGYVVAVADYVYSSGGRVWPANLHSCRDAVRFLRKNAERFGIDGQRIAAMGESSGGHMAALLGTAPEYPRTQMRPAGVISSDVQAFVSFFGPTDLASLYQVAKTRPKIIGALGGRLDQIPDRYDEASPLDHATADDPPAFLFHGKRDTAVPVDQSVRLAERLKGHGVPVRLVLLQNATHGVKPKGRNHDYLLDVYAFLEAIWNGRAEEADGVTDWTPGPGAVMPVVPW
jgi:acetyl esterase/lipase